MTARQIIEAEEQDFLIQDIIPTGCDSKITLKDIETRRVEVRYENGWSMNHPWQAMWAWPFQRRHKEIKGCPYGSGSSEWNAIGDLLFRTNKESGTNFDGTTLDVEHLWKLD